MSFTYFVVFILLIVYQLLCFQLYRMLVCFSNLTSATVKKSIRHKKFQARSLSHEENTTNREEAIRYLFDAGISSVRCFSMNSIKRLHAMHLKSYPGKEEHISLPLSSSSKDPWQ